MTPSRKRWKKWKLVLLIVFLLSIKHIIWIERRRCKLSLKASVLENLVRKYMFERNAAQSKRCHQFDYNKLDSPSQLLTFWSLINRKLGTIKLNGWHVERERSVQNVFHLAQLLRGQKKIKRTRDGHIVASLKMWTCFHMQLKHNVESARAEASSRPKS